MGRIFQSIPLKIGISILVIELLLLLVVGAILSYRLSEKIDQRVSRKITIPVQLLSSRMLSEQVVNDLTVLSNMLQVRVEETFIFSPTGVVTHGSSPEQIGRHYYSFLSSTERRVFKTLGRSHGDVRYTDESGAKVVSTLDPIIVDGKHVGSLYLRLDGDEIHAFKQQIIRQVAIITVGLITAVVLGLTLIVNRIVTPRIERTSAVLRRIVDGDFYARIVHYGPQDQLGVMMSRVDEMIKTIQQYTQRLQLLNIAAETFAEATTKREILTQATDLIEQHLPVRLDEGGDTGGLGLNGSDVNRKETVFTLPVADDDKGYTVMSFVASRDTTELKPMEYDFIRTLSRMVHVASERVAAFQDISMAEARYRQLFTSALEGIIRVQPGGKVTEANPAFAKMLGFVTSDRVFREITDIGSQIFVEPLDYEQLKSRLETEERVVDLEVNLKRQDGAIFPASLSAQSVRDEYGRISTFDIRLFNIVERKRRERAERDHLAAEAVSVAKSKLVDDLEWKNKQLVEALDELKATQMQLMHTEKMAAVGGTAGGVAHDLNNILSGLVSYPEMLQGMLPPDSESYQLVEEIADSGRKAASIVHDLLALTDQDMHERTLLLLNQIIAEFLESAEFAKDISAYPGIEIDYELVHEDLFVLGSKAHLKRAIKNLIHHCLESIAGEGSIILSLATQSFQRSVDVAGEESNDTFALVKITDTGPPIPQENLTRIFEPFYVRKVMGKRGTGLGLTVVWNVVHEHNGKIEVESDEAGTVYSLFLPLAELPAGGETTTITDGGADLRGEGRILVVDDEPLQRDIAKKMLVRFGYEVESCSSGEEAVSYLQERSFDLLLLDMLMPPGINGLETYRRVLEAHPRQKAIIVSGYSENQDVNRAMQLGAGAFVKKPYTMYQIARSVKEELTTRRFALDE